MKYKRISFYDKYKYLHNDWNLDEIETLEIINDYSFRLVDELCDDEIWNISNFFRDNRTNDEYIYDILDGQIIEEFVCSWFRRRGYKAIRNGSDANGKLVRNQSSKITTKPDLLVDNKCIEIQMSRNGRLKHYHIKYNKGIKILNKLNTLMMIVGNEYFIVDSELISKCVIVNNGLWGGKECYQLSECDITYKDMGINKR